MVIALLAHGLMQLGDGLERWSVSDATGCWLAITVALLS